MRIRPLLPVPRWNDSSLSIGFMERDSGSNADVESMVSWNFPSRSMNCVYVKKSSQLSTSSLNDPSSRSPSSARRSRNPMLKEESFHLGTGNNGLIRIVKAGKMPPEVMQRFFYKWIPTAFDLFGTDNSSSAHWAYVWGLKGRYDERDNQVEPDKAKLNEYSRDLYRQEITKLIERLNMFIPERERWLRVPDLTL